jgi:dihydrofolate synthase/folylpolyglutamate synthase
LDTAHNQASARALVESLAELPQQSRRTLILSISRDKEVRAIVGELAPHFDRFIVTQYRENPRAVVAEQLATILRNELADSKLDIAISHTPGEAWCDALQTAAPGEIICITGSFYLAAEMRRLILDWQRSSVAGLK